MYQPSTRLASSMCSAASSAPGEGTMRPSSASSPTATKSASCSASVTPIAASVDAVLDGGVNDALNLDSHGKALSYLLLDLPVRVPAALADRLRPGG